MSEADATALIDLYVELTLQRIPFTPENVAAIREELVRLIPTVLDEDAAPISLCDQSGSWNGCNEGNAGGAGGEGGAPIAERARR